MELWYCGDSVLDCLALRNEFICCVGLKINTLEPISMWCFSFLKLFSKVFFAIMLQWKLVGNGIWKYCRLDLSSEYFAHLNILHMATNMSPISDIFVTIASYKLVIVSLHLTILTLFQNSMFTYHNSNFIPKYMFTSHNSDFISKFYVYISQFCLFLKF